MGSALEDGFGWAAGEAANLDWAGALGLLAVGLAVAGAAMAVGLAAAYYLRHGPLATGSGGPLAASILRRWHRARGTADRARWLCEGCRSWNVPSADTCYRGCGARGAVAMALPPNAEGADRSTSAADPAGAADGRAADEPPTPGEVGPPGGGVERPF